MSEGAAPLTVTLLAIAFALAGPVVAMAPLGMAPLTIATGFLATGAERIKSGQWPAVPRRAIGLPAAFLAWCALSLIWDIDPADGANKLLQMVAVFAAALLLLGIAGRLGADQRLRLARALIGGAVVGLVLLGIETIFDYPLYRTVIGSGPKLVDLLESKRSVDAFPILIWPAALALDRLDRPRLGILLAVVFAVASFKLTASTATITMLVSLAVYGLALWSGQAVRSGLKIATALAFVLIIPVSMTAYDLGGVTTPWLKISARHRIEIWHFAAERSIERPLFGHGLNSSRVIPNGNEVSAIAVEAHLPQDKPIIPLHPHDAFLQVWLELGAVGVVLAGYLLLSIVNASVALPPAAARFASAGYVASLTIAGLAFGIWQSWWMATLAFGMVAYASIAGRGEHG